MRLRGGGEDRENDESLVPGIADAMGYPLRRHEHRTGLHRKLAALEHERNNFV